MAPLSVSSIATAVYLTVSSIAIAGNTVAMELTVRDTAVAMELTVRDTAVAMELTHGQIYNCRDETNEEEGPSLRYLTFAVRRLG